MHICRGLIPLIAQHDHKQWDIYNYVYKPIYKYIYNHVYMPTHKHIYNYVYKPI